MLYFHQPPKAVWKGCMLKVQLDKKPWTEISETSRQILLEETSLSDGGEPLNVSDHVQVKSPQFSRRLQLFFSPCCEDGTKNGLISPFDQYLVMQPVSLSP